jgi:hypothetical protein
VDSKQQRIAEAAREESCPQCGRPLGRTPEEGHRIGSGRLADGVFCSLGCFAEFHADYLEERIEQGTPSRN